MNLTPEIIDSLSFAFIIITIVIAIAWCRVKRKKNEADVEIAEIKANVVYTHKVMSIMYGALNDIACGNLRIDGEDNVSIAKDAIRRVTEVKFGK